MSNDNSWQKELDTFLADSAPSADTRVLARSLAASDKDNEALDAQEITELEQALHIEQHLDDIGLQPLSPELEHKLQSISKTESKGQVIWGRFDTHWKKASAIAATIAVVMLFSNINSNAPNSQQPTLAEIKQAEQELALALQYMSLAQTKSVNKIQQTLDENIRNPLNQSLLKPLNHFKESS